MIWSVSKDYYAWFTKFKAGTQDVIVYASYDPDEKANRFYIEASVYTKRKKIDENYNNRDTTGVNGLKPLIEIRKAIINFESFLSERYRCDSELIIQWTDNRRRDAYIYGLKDYGYKVGMRNNKKCLFKKIKPKQGDKC